MDSTETQLLQMIQSERSIKEDALKLVQTLGQEIELWRELALRLIKWVPHDHSEATGGTSWSSDDKGRVKVTHVPGNPEGNCPRCKLDREVAGLTSAE